MMSANPAALAASPSSLEHNIWCSMFKASVPSVKEPVGLSRTDDKKLDGVLLTVGLWKVNHGLSVRNKVSSIN
jgi:hypothetical protein